MGVSRTPISQNGCSQPKLRSMLNACLDSMKIFTIGFDCKREFFLMSRGGSKIDRT